MNLIAGQRLGPYEIIDKIGAGGMGVVYRALDTRLSRNVAVKVLTEAAVSSSDFAARFEREAVLLASLNHPGIAAIYDVEEVDGAKFLVLELITGESLESRLERGALDYGDAVPLFLQAAQAVEVAHQNRVLHRDLKPGNIMLTPEGTVKILDFGLAKGLDGELGGKPSLQTREGELLGTASYFAPEQLRGQKLDCRADIWALGCCLYEALSGKTAFPGETLGETLAAVMSAEPDWQALPRSIPASTVRLLKDCLQKDPAQRLPSMQAFAERLERRAERTSPETMTGPPQEPIQALAFRPAPESSPGAFIGSRKSVLGATFLLFLSAASLGLALSQAKPAPAALPIRSLSMVLPEAWRVPDQHPGLVITPDGETVVATLMEGETRKLFARSLATGVWTPVNGSDGAAYPFLSRDGLRVGFFSEGALKVASLAGGPATLVLSGLRQDDFLGAAWVAPDKVVFATTPGGLQWVSPGGGQAATLLGPDAAQGDFELGWPCAGVGGDEVVFSVRKGGSFEGGQVESLNLTSGQRQVLARQAFAGRIAPSGTLMFVRGGAVVAAQNGQGETAVGKVWSDPARGESCFAAGPLGTLVYLGPAGSVQARLSWVDRVGVHQAVESLETQEARLSPDDRFIAYRNYTKDGREIWIHERSTSTNRRLTRGKNAASPTWSPDAKRLAFASDRLGPYNIFSQATQGGEAQRLTKSRRRQYPKDWSADGRWLVFEEEHPSNGIDILALGLDPNSGLPLQNQEPMALLASESEEREPSLSPDGQWMAYQSDRSGLVEVYATRFPQAGPPLSLSQGPGSQPLWLEDEVLFVRGKTLMSVEIRQSQDGLRIQPPRALFETSFLANGRRSYDAAADESLLIISEPEEGRSQNCFGVVLNGFR